MGGWPLSNGNIGGYYMARTKATNAQMSFPNGSGYMQVGPNIIAWGTATTSSIGTAACTEVSGTTTFPITFS